MTEAEIILITGSMMFSSGLLLGRAWGGVTVLRLRGRLEAQALLVGNLWSSNYRLANQLEARRAKDPVRGENGRWVKKVA